MSHPTVVTAFFPIRSKFPSDTYMAWAARFMRMRAPVILYTAPHLVERFLGLRGFRTGHHGLLEVVPMEATDMEMWELYKARWVVHHAKDREAAYHTPELYAVWANKAFFVADAVRRNPFGSTHFYWCDVGAFRTADPHPSFPSLRRLVELTGDRILMSTVNRLGSAQETERRADGILGDFEHVDRIVGGLWGGSAAACRRFCSAYEAQLLRYFHAGRFAGKDQSVYLSAILEDPSMVSVYQQTDDPALDTWFFQTRLLTDQGVVGLLDASYPRVVALSIPSVTVNLMGGLGNQMFQVAAAWSYALRHGYRLRLAPHKEVVDSRPSLYWDSVFHRFQHVLDPSVVSERAGFQVWWEPAATVFREPPALSEGKGVGLYLRGYFQSPGYSSGFHDLLRDMLAPSATRLRDIRRRYGDLLAKRDRVVVVHARRGDYLAAAAYHGPLNVDYYARAMGAIQVTNPHYLLVSDDPLFWVTALPHLPALQTFTFDILGPTEITEVDCLALCSQFVHFVLANSSYSWWFAFLAGPAAKVVAPAAWFGPAGPSAWSDIYMPAWLRV